jgi:hypothetical protein
MVAVRARPMSDQELRSNQHSVWDIVPGESGCVEISGAWRERLRKGASEYQFGISDNYIIYLFPCFYDPTYCYDRSMRPSLHLIILF